MTEKIVTIGALLDSGLIKRSTSVKISTSDLAKLKLIKPLPKEKTVGILDLKKNGLVEDK